jgi:anion-transporting  ArsA/GET3 family ATPase
MAGSRDETPDAAANGAVRNLEQLLATKEIAISCGSGGVGKTTTAAAAAAMAATHLGGKVLVLTVDPARRLANALGLEQFGNTEVRVPAEAFATAGLAPRGELWAAMLDTKQSWDDLVRQHAPDPKTRDRILSNKIYENISGRFIQSHDYIAMERLYELHTSGVYDLIVVDTPPTRNAIDFLDAPERMADFFSSRPPSAWRTSSVAACCAGSPRRASHAWSRSPPSRSTRSPTASSVPTSWATSTSSSACSRPWRPAS